MSLRVLLLSLIVAGLSIYAWRNWFRALCSAIVLMAFLENAEMPRHILGIQGFNLWNLLLLNVVGGWLAQRHSEGLEWDMPRRFKVAFFFFISVIVWAFLRILIDPTLFYYGTTTSIVVDYFVNPMRFLLPAFLLYDGCRTRDRVLWALSAILLMYFLLSVQTIRYMGLNFNMSGNELSERGAKVIHHSVGYHRVDMSMMLAGASWAMIAFSCLVQRKSVRLAIYASAALVLVAQALTAGRAGYATWALVGLTLCISKWRKVLPLLPLAAIAVVMLVPGVKERMLAGFGGQSGAIIYETNSSEITSGRTDMWPYVIDKIKQSPIIGYGRLAMVRTGLSDRLEGQVGEGYGHPHNAYLEILLDDGIIGFLCVFPIYFIVIRRSFSLFVTKQDRICEAAGGVALALFLALVFAAMGAQTFYPREGVLGMWAAAGVALRVWVEREHEKTQLVDESTDDSSLPEFVYPA